MSAQMKERHKIAEREDNPLLKELNAILGIEFFIFIRFINWDLN